MYMLNHNNGKCIYVAAGVCRAELKVVRFWEDLAGRMIPRTFRRFFRMRSENVQLLKDWWNPEARLYPGGRMQTDPLKMVAMTLYWLGNESACKHIAFLFGVTEDCFITCTEFIMNLILQKA